MTRRPPAKRAKARSTKRLVCFYGLDAPSPLYPDAVRFILDREGSHVVHVGFVAEPDAPATWPHAERPVAMLSGLGEDLAGGWALVTPTQEAALVKRIKADGWRQVVIGVARRL